ncbi:histone-lysine N-methyltransferase SETD2-like [Sycon ciliatum]|uniref:histone-lysine N-methyltransferase SETD2-like n=1 Tax=Sycon ciliatum TaxID=27933 RepID=UPI0031F674BE|eukprot:scpid58119/ scgid20252/ Histone-lysine N-methyltransferase SETD2; HIF-1; Huntingtin yeast partner B; Huntingtin-interacting protein 1; Huntingtin-interacting protein B; Lysine N-methyltransferase 3A; SET domain-containing protein 2; p231HBP
MSSDPEENAPSPLGPDDGKRPAEWQKISDSIYLVDNGRTKNGRLDRKMRCDCDLEYDDEGKPLEGCGEDCINRLLMIECNPKSCPCGEFCSNQRFQKKQNAPVEVYHTHSAKGWGLRAQSDIADGVFVREYVGEVCSFVEFQRRTEEYHEQGRRHHYFMTLRSDQIIDATLRGSVSRFMNHSCEPNCETQKWTVNGRLKVGFFTKRDIAADEELTFDYQFERIGEGAQECHCGTPSCSGYIGGKQQKSERGNVVVIPGGRQSKKSRDASGDGDDDEAAGAVMEDELTRTVRQCCRGDGQGLVREEDVLVLSRVMVTADSTEHRMLVLEALLNTHNDKCLRMFVKLQGLSLLWSWMVDLEDGSNGPMAMRVLEALEHLPVMNRNVLKDSKVLSQVTRWSEAQMKPVPVNGTVADAVSSSANVAAAKTVGETTFSSESCVENGNRQPDSAMNVDSDSLQATITPSSCSDSGVESPSSSIEHANPSIVGGSAEMDVIKQKAEQLLEKWSSLKEVYRIPKKGAKGPAAPPPAPGTPTASSQPPSIAPPRDSPHLDTLSSYERERLRCKIKEAQKLVQRAVPRPAPTPEGLQQVAASVLGLAAAVKLSQVAAVTQAAAVASQASAVAAAAAAGGALPTGAGVLGPAPGVRSVIPPVLGAAALAAGIPPPPILFTNPAAVTTLLQSGLLSHAISPNQQPQQQVPIPAVMAAAAAASAAAAATIPSSAIQQQQQGQQPVQTGTPVVNWQSSPPPRRLPQYWRSAQDSEGKTYYYHVERRVSQWDFPISDGADGDETPPLPTEPPTDDECHTPDETPPASDCGTPMDCSLTSTIATFSPPVRKLSSTLQSQSKPPQPTSSSSTPKRNSSSSSSRGMDLTPVELRQLKESFRSDLSKLIVQLLNPYRKPDCKRARIENDGDFKHLARKLTFIVVEKELKGKSCYQLEYSPSVRAKTQDFVHSYMKRFKEKYIRC